MRHQVDRFIYFGDYLNVLNLLIVGKTSFMTAFHFRCFLSNDLIIKYAIVAIESCCVIQNRLGRERKLGCVHELMETIEETLLFVVGWILHLIKRSDNSFQSELTEPAGSILKSHRVAWILVKELLHCCPEVSAPFHGYSWPMMNISFKAKYRIKRFANLTKECREYNYHFVKMVIQTGYDLNKADCEGNTILHVVTSEILQEIDSMHNSGEEDAIKQLIETRLKIIEICLEKGSYPHARNKKGQCPGDGPPNAKIQRFDPDDIMTQFKNLLAKYDSTMTLKYLVAKKIVESQIAYKDILPKHLVEFVNMH